MKFRVGDKQLGYMGREDEWSMTVVGTSSKTLICNAHSRTLFNF